jgi:hypothetical protein
MADVANRKCNGGSATCRPGVAGILFNASADLLVAWHTAALTDEAPDWTATQRRFAAGVEQVRRARLDGDLDRLDRACRGMVDIARDGAPVATPVRLAVAALEQAVAVAADPSPCLIGCAACATAARRRPSVRHPVARLGHRAAAPAEPRRRRRAGGYQAAGSTSCRSLMSTPARWSGVRRR